MCGFESTPGVAAAGYLTCATQDVVLPEEHCDDRVEIMQADARTLNIHDLYTKFGVGLQHVQRFCRQRYPCNVCILTYSSMASMMAFWAQMHQSSTRPVPVKCICASVATHHSIPSNAT